MPFVVININIKAFIFFKFACCSQSKAFLKFSEFSFSFLPKELLYKVKRILP